MSPRSLSLPISRVFPECAAELAQAKAKQLQLAMSCINGAALLADWERMPSLDDAMQAAPVLELVETDAEVEAAEQAAAAVRRELVAALVDLATLKLAGCTALRSLDTARLPSLARLSVLVLARCDNLLELPDLSALEKLYVEHLPNKLKPWEMNGRKAFTLPPH